MNTDDQPKGTVEVHMKREAKKGIDYDDHHQDEDAEEPVCIFPGYTWPIL